MVKTLTIFCGSSIGRDEARRIFPDAEVPGPIKRGDLEKVTTDAVCIIDGFFFQELSLSARELMTALKKGKRIWGASSMGALRAAECRDYGCTGVGAIYEGYATGSIASDDDVAVALSPDNFRQLSDATVDIDFFLRGEVDDATRALILKSVRGLYFSQRRLDTALRAMGMEPARAEALVTAFDREPKQKWLDAMACLEAVKKELRP